MSQQDMFKLLSYSIREPRLRSSAFYDHRISLDFFFYFIICELFILNLVIDFFLVHDPERSLDGGNMTRLELNALDFYSALLACAYEAIICGCNYNELALVSTCEYCCQD